MKTIELEVLTTAFQIEMDSSDYVIVYSKSEEDVYSQVFWWNHEMNTIEDTFDQTPAEITGKMTGWSKVPFYNPSI